MLRHRPSLHTILKTRINKLVISAVVVLSAGLLSVQSALAGPGVWTTGGPRGGEINAIAITPNGATIFAATDHGGLMRSTNAGGSWGFRNGTLGNGMQADAVAIQNSLPSTMYMAASPNFTSQVFKSTNGGMTWNPANTGISGSVTSIAVNQPTPTILYAATDSNGIFKSTNGGTSWAAVNTGLPRNGSFYTQFFAVRIHPTTPTTIYAVGANGIGPRTRARAGPP